MFPEVRHAAKVIIPTNCNKYLFTEGKSSRLNIPGGGIELQETAVDAAIREVDEETGLQLCAKSLYRIGERRHILTNANGEPFHARWDIFKTDPVDASGVRPGDVDIRLLDFGQAMSSIHSVTDAAKDALKLYVLTRRRDTMAAQFQTLRQSSRAFQSLPSVL